MTLRLSRRMEVLRASEVREMLKVTARPEVISFAGGLPAPELFRLEPLAEMAAELIRTDGRRALQYSTTEGYVPLRRWIAERMCFHWGAHYTSDEVLITTGSQQGLDLTGKLFLDPGDTVFCESPTYLAAISAFNQYGARWVDVPCDDEGMDIEALEGLLARGERPRLVYVVPTCQNPSGRTWSVERRRRFMELVTRHEIPVIEDNPYGDVVFKGETPPTLASFDTAGLVIVLGTFSKILCPGLRVAWLGAAPALFEKYVILKQAADLHTPIFNQMLIARYLERFDIEDDLARIRSLYGERRDAMIAALEREMPEGVQFTRPDGGLFLWVQLPHGLSARDLLPLAVERNVAIVPGGAFYPNGGHEDTMRLNFSNMPPERIREGIRRLGEAVRELLSRESAEPAVAGGPSARAGTRT